MNVITANRDSIRLAHLLMRQERRQSDAQLLSRFHQHLDSAAFAELMKRHGPLVYGACRRILRDASDVDDAFQATFLVLLRKAGHLQEPNKLGNWLYGVALRTAWEIRSMKKRRQQCEGRRQREARNQPSSPPIEVERQEICDILDEEIAKLPARYQEAVVTCLLQGTGRRAAAQQMKIAEGTLSSRLATAKRLLVTALKRRGLAVSAATLEILFDGELNAQVPLALQSMTLALSTSTTSSISGIANTVMKTLLVKKLLGGTLIFSMISVLALYCASFWTVTACEAGLSNSTFAIYAIPSDEKKTPPGNLVGKVTNPDGKPVAGAEIVYYEGNDKKHTTITKADGTFRLDNLPSEVNRRNKLVVRSDEWALAYLTSPMVYPNTDHDLGVIPLKPGRRITGQLLDADGKPRSSTIIDIIPNKFELAHTFNKISEPIRIETDGNGRYTSPPLPMSCLDLMIRVPERLLVQESIQLAPGDKAYEKNIKLQSDAPQELKILNDKGEPIAGATVSGLYGLEAPVSDKNGIIVIRGYSAMPSVLYKVNAPGYPQSELLIREQKTTVTLKKPTYLHGTVVDVDTNEPIPLMGIGICQLREEKGKLQPFG